MNIKFTDKSDFLSRKTYEMGSEQQITINLNLATQTFELIVGDHTLSGERLNFKLALLDTIASTIIKSKAFNKLIT